MEYILSENNEKIFPHDNKEKKESKKHEEPVMSDLPSQDSDFTNDENHWSDETKLLLQVSLLVFGAPVLKTVTKFQNQLFKKTIQKKY